MKNKLCVLLSVRLVWILDRLPNRRLLTNETALKMQFGRLLNDEDIMRIVLHEKPQLINWESGPIGYETPA